MKRLATRLLLAVVLVAAIQAVAYTTRNAKVGAPEVDLRGMPFTLGTWSGRDVEIEDLIFRKSGADLMVNREYTNDAGRSVGATTSVFSDWYAGFMHHPEVCYKAAGFQLVGQNVVRLETAKHVDFPVDVLTYERDGRRIQVLYWYQLGDQRVADRRELGRARWNLPRGEAMPPLIKVILQTSQTDAKTAQDRLKGFAEHVLSFIEGSAGPSS